MVSLIIIKPNYEKFADKILSLLGGEVIFRERFMMTKDLCRKHYEHHLDKQFYPDLEKYMLSGECIGAIIKGGNPRSKVEEIRKHYMDLVGEKNLEKNVVHVSDSEENGKREVEMFKNYFGWKIKR
ncbi:MAG: nucleoside-diphosphate kinase [Christensenellaceae bacterium]|jgi:nucleoside-diphosphate kinase|nr:nucleoside-diphosphate kinase [Christensenellaceae bacterium]